MQWRKPQDMKYTDMCIFIDQNIAYIAEHRGENPEVEDKICNYLWLLVKALAIKKSLFQNFSDYDPYCFYAAERLFNAFIKNYQNQGKVIKGKLIKPIKSCLNYTKALLYPMKVEYQNKSFREVISEETVSKKFDAFNMREHMKADAVKREGVNESFKLYLQDSLNNIDKLIDKVLAKTPFSESSLDYKHLKISLLLNCLNTLKVRRKLDTTLTTVVLWKLPKSMASYVKILLNELFTELKKEILECYQEVSLNDDMLEKIITLSGKEENLYEEQY